MISLKVSPGVVRNGTIMEAAGRYYDTNLVRWYEGGVLGPISGWRNRGRTETDVVTGACRAILPWRDNTNVSWIGLGTHSGLFVMDRGGTVYDITPAGFTTGHEHATLGGGYGNNAYGTGAYGTPRPDDTLIIDATVQSLDHWLGTLLAISPDDGTLYQWNLDTGTPAVAVSGAPTGRAVLVTNEQHVMVLGANGDPRLVQWSDQRDETMWTPSATNQSRDFPIQTVGRLMRGIRVRGANLLLTDHDAHVATFIGEELVFGFQCAGVGCGLIGPGAAVGFDSRAAWMGSAGFFLFDGSARPLPCDVADFVFGDINKMQVSQVTASHNSAYGEVRWDYPSADSIENDRYVCWNYRQNVWHVGYMTRLCGADRGPTTYPLMVDDLGRVLEHEVGLDYEDLTPYAETGPIELVDPRTGAAGDNIMHVRKLWTDEITAGDVKATFFTRYAPTGTEYTKGPYTLSPKTDLKFSARELRARFTGERKTAWRLGEMRMQVAIGGGR